MEEVLKGVLFLLEEIFWLELLEVGRFFFLFVFLLDVVLISGLVLLKVFIIFLGVDILDLWIKWSFWLFVL